MQVLIAGAGRLGTQIAQVLSAGRDEDNLVISLLAKRQFGVGRVAARVNEGRTPGSSTSGGAWTWPYPRPPR
uniref:hypothetical protein n=1 Tax=Streptomyces corallincola TaxID=2851888 RepID=UPI001FE36B26|nr:hypothetical protein [Streptomyces corallincola]